MSDAEGPCDRVLWEQARRGDGESFGMILDRHREAVRAFCARRTGSSDAADDAVSVVFLEAWRRRADVDLVHDSALPWLYGVAANTLRRRTRTAARHRALLDRLPSEHTAPDHADEVAARLDDAAQVADLHTALSRLRPTAAVAVVAAVALVGGPSAGPAHASWTAAPETAPAARPADGKVRQWASQCTDLGVGGVGVGGLDPAAASGRRPVLVDRRGDSTFCVDVATGSATESDPLIAMAGLRAEADGGQGVQVTVSPDPFRPPATDDLLVLGGDLMTPPAEDPAGTEDVISLQALVLYGLAGVDVRGVDLVLANGLRITATVGGGVRGAWWPSGRGDPTGVRLEATTVDGSTSVMRAQDALLP